MFRRIASAHQAIYCIQQFGSCGIGIRVRGESAIGNRLSNFVEVSILPISQAFAGHQIARQHE